MNNVLLAKALAGSVVGLCALCVTPASGMPLMELASSNSYINAYLNARGIDPDQYNFTSLDVSPTPGGQTGSTYSKVISSNFNTNGFTVTTQMALDSGAVPQTVSVFDFYFTVTEVTNIRYTVQFDVTLGANQPATPYFGDTLRAGNTDLIPPVDVTGASVPYQEYHLTLQPNTVYHQMYYQTLTDTGNMNTTNSTSVVTLTLEPVPEPAAFAILGMGASALLRRRH